MIVITERAATEILKQLDKRNTPEDYVRLGVQGGGCSGYSYLFEFSDDMKENDHLFEKDGVKIIVDPKSFVYLTGMELDFETGISGHGFKFKNPNVKESCGCGESITF